jgi:predicted metal-dependent hydrolase
MISNDFGEIIFFKNKKIKHINVKILPAGLQVNLPAGVSEKEALRFIETKRTIILRKQQRLQQSADNQLIVSPENPLKTLTFTVMPVASERADVFFLLKNNILTIEFPKEKDCRTKEMQKIFFKGINYFLRKEAKRLLPVRLKQLADIHGFIFNNVTIKSTKSRWGSCAHSKKNILQKHFSINLSFYLLLTTPQLIDYVLLHELCHTHEMNHSPRFWLLMDKVTNGASNALRNELKKYQIPNV